MIAEKNNYLFTFFFVTLAFFSLASSASALHSEDKELSPYIIAKAEVDKSTVSIGDGITYTVTVTTKTNIEVQFTDFSENFGDFAIRDFGASKKRFFGKETHVKWYVLDIYKTGTYTIPEAIIKFKENETTWREIKTKEVIINVESVLEESSEEQDIRDIKDPLSFPRKYLTLIFIVLILVLIALGTLGTILLAKKVKKPVALPPKPPHEIAYEDLRQLMQKSLIKNGKIKEYYFELSAIERRYLENRFNLRAPEMTTEEFLVKLKDSDTLSLDHKSLLREFLSHCDLVKFAKYGPSEKEIDLSFNSAKRLIDETKKTESLNEKK